MARRDDKTYTEDEIRARLQEELPHWYYEDGWIRRKYRTSVWKATLMVITTVGHLRILRFRDRQADESRGQGRDGQGFRARQKDRRGDPVAARQGRGRLGRHTG